MNQYFQENRAEEGLGKRSIRGGTITMAARGVNVFLQIASTMCLARLLVPEDFGLVAIVSAVAGFAIVMPDLGTSDATIQKPHITKSEISSLFWLTTLVGCVMAFLFFLSSHLVAWFYHDERLVKLMMLTSSTFVLSALSLQHFALLRRALEFRKIAVIQTISNLIGVCAAIAMAFAGAEYWALAARPVVTSLIMLLGVWGTCRWLPGLPQFTSEVKGMLKFGFHLSNWVFADTAVKSIDRAGIGAVAGARELGFYQNARTVYDNSLQMVALPMFDVSISCLSKLQENGQQFRKAWFSMLSTLAFFAFPAFVLLSVVGSDLVVVLFGSKWRPAGILLTIAALRGIPQTFERAVGSAHIAAGRADLWARWAYINLGTHLIALVFGLPFGAMGVITAYMICDYVLLITVALYAHRFLKIPAFETFKTIGPQSAGIILMLMLGALLHLTVFSALAPVVRILAISICCLSVYLAVVCGLFKLLQPLKVAGSALEMIFAGINRFRPAWLSSNS